MEICKVSMEMSKAGTKNRNPDGLSLPNQNTIIINIILQYFLRNGKNTKNGLEQSKTKNRPPLKRI